MGLLHNGVGAQWTAPGLLYFRYLPYVSSLESMLLVYDLLWLVPAFGLMIVLAAIQLAQGLSLIHI